MKNIYFPEEDITKNDLYFICYMIERVARRLHQKNVYVVNTIGRDNLTHLICVANVLHAENPLDIEDQWIEDYDLKKGDFDITNVDKTLVRKVPTPLQMGKVYTRLIVDTMTSEETYIDGILRVYNSDICNTLDNYNASAYYEPSYVIARAYNAGSF